MSKKVKISLISFLASFPFWWGTNVLEGKLENFFLSQMDIKTPKILIAQLVPEPDFVTPVDIQAKAAFSIKINGGEKWDIQYQKNIKNKLPIASLTKLMTALVVLENYDLSFPVKISQKAVGQEENIGKLKAGEILTVKDLLYVMLIESSNDAAYALAEVIGVDNFVDIMNWEAKSLGLKNTYFSNPTGLDDPQNYSTAQDLAILTKYLLQKPFLWEILNISQLNLYLSDGTFHHQLKNTNELLGKLPGIFGGKTGWSPQASGCILLVLKTSENHYSINVILGAPDRFSEMKKLIQTTVNK